MRLNFVALNRVLFILSYFIFFIFSLFYLIFIHLDDGWHDVKCVVCWWEDEQGRLHKTERIKEDAIRFGRFDSLVGPNRAATCRQCQTTCGKLKTNRVLFILSYFILYFISLFYRKTNRVLFILSLHDSMRIHGPVVLAISHILHATSHHPDAAIGGEIQRGRELMPQR